jgi:transposase InsO family protein/transposase-like protein
VSMTGKIDRVEVITSVQRRRRWSAEEKAQIVQETYAPGMSVSPVARQHGVAPNQVFSWRRLYAEGALLAVGAGEEVVPASECRALQHQVRELQRLLGKKTLENEVLRDALELVQPKKRLLRSPSLVRDDTRMTAIADGLGVVRSNLGARVAPQTAQQRRGRRPQPDDGLVAEIKALIAGQPTYGYRRIHALLRRQRHEQGGPTVNVKRIYRVMKAHGLLLERHTGGGEERRHDGRVAVDHPDTRWCSDGFKIGCDNGERVRIAFTLDCCDREVISWVATTGGISSGDIRDLMIESIERRFGLVGQLPVAIEWLSDNGSPYTAGETRALARDIGLVPRTTPTHSPHRTAWRKPSSKPSSATTPR